MDSPSAPDFDLRHDSGTRGADAECAALRPPHLSAPVAYIMSRFPLLTETFILREMLELERQGAILEVFPLLKAKASVRHQELDRLKAAVHYTPFISAAIIAANVHFLARKPRGYLHLLWSVLKGNLGSANLFVGALGIFPKSVYLAKVAEERGIRHIHAHYATHPALTALIISELTGIDFSFTAHAHDIFLHQRMVAQKVERARFVAAISRHNKDYLLRLAPGVSPEKIKVVHCGIELEKYNAGSNGKPRAPSNIPEGQITAICVASLQAYKGIGHLIRACAEVRARIPGFKCLVVGEGVERAKLEVLINELDLDHAVHLLGGRPQHEVAELLREADLFVLPSVVAPSGQMDGIPVALMEAMATRLSVISSRLSGIPELVEHGVNGLLVAPGDEPALADAITLLSGDAEMRRRMGERGREKVAEEFELQHCVASLRRMFEEPESHVRVMAPIGAGSGHDRAAGSIDDSVIEWVRGKIAPIGGEPPEIHVKHLGGGADSDVFDVQCASGTCKRGGYVLKLHRPHRFDAAGALEAARMKAENDYGALTFLWSEFSASSSVLAVPRPVGLDLDHAAVLMEKCPGERLDLAMRWARFRPGQHEALPRWFAGCGEWLARFHQATARQQDPEPVFAELEASFLEDIKSCRERGLGEELATLAARHFEANKRAAFSSVSGLVGRHCDFAPYNVLVTDDRISVIDFEGLQPGAAYDDLSYFLHMLELTPWYHLGRGTLALLRRQFLEAYQQHMKLDPPVLDFFALLTAVRVMAHTPTLRTPATRLDALKHRQRLNFYQHWFRERLL